METFVFYLILAILVLTYGFDLWLSMLNYKNRNAEIPSEVDDVYDQESYQKWQSYSMENFRISFVSSLVRFIIIISFLVFRVFPWFYTIAGELTENIHLKILIFLGLYYIVEFIVTTIFSYYRQFVIEERFGFNKSTQKTFISDRIKSLILTVILGGGIIYILSLLFHNVGNWFYIAAWVTIIVIILFVNLFYVKLFVPLFNKLRPLEDGELKDRIIEFAQSSGYEITKISVIDASRRSTKLNAFFSGLGKFKQVVLYDTLIEKMSDDQIISVLAHEIGHCKHNHITKNLFFSIINISIFLGILLFAVRSDLISQAFGFEEANFGFGLIIFMILITPIGILFGLIRSQISRKFEYQSDRFACIHGYQKAMEEALKVLAKENFANLTPHPIYVALKYSHPPIDYRIRAIRNVEC